MFWQTAASEQQSESDEEWERKQTGGVWRRAKLQGADTKTATPVKHRAIEYSSSDKNTALTVQFKVDV